MVKYKVIVLNGAPRAGKDTVAEMIKQIHPQTINVSLAEPAKRVMRFLGKNPTDKTPETRAFLCDLKNLLDEYYDESFNYLEKEIRLYTDELVRYGFEDTAFYVIVHSREPEDIKRIKTKYNAITVLVEGSKDRIISAADASNEADRHIHDIEYDYTINNKGTLEELNKNVLKFLQEI